MQSIMTADNQSPMRSRSPISTDMSASGQGSQKTGERFDVPFIQTFAMFKTLGVKL